MDPLSAAATIGGVLGIAGLALQSVHKSIEGLQLLSVARHFSNTADRQRSRIVFERQRLLEWYNTVDPQHSHASNSLEALNWNVIGDTALQLEELLCDADRLEKKYNLVIKEDDVGKLGERVEQPTSKNVLERFVSKLRPASPFSQTAQLIDRDATPALRIQYMISGKTKLDELIADIEAFVSKLCQYVSDKQQRMIAGGMNYLLREALNRASAKDDIAELQSLINAGYQDQRSTEIKSLCALPELKQRRLDLNLDLTKQENPRITSGIPGRQNANTVTRAARIKGPEVIPIKSISHNRQLASYKSQSVLLEWKAITAGLEEKLEWRVKALGTLLTQTTPEVLGSLACKGTFKDIGKSRYGFVFALPASSISPSESVPVSLFDMLNDQPPSIDERMRIARQLSRSVRQLHTIGWLHKALRSENIIFCPIASDNAERGPYLAGFGYARAADPTQFSEIPPAAPESDIYCHSDLLGGEARMFRKKYDMFALGTMLIEIGLWKRFSALLLASAGLPEDDATLLYRALLKRTTLIDADGEGSINHQLKMTCSPAFCEAISICIRGNLPKETSEVNEDDDDEDEDEEDSLKVQQKVVELLEA